MYTGSELVSKRLIRGGWKSSSCPKEATLHFHPLPSPWTGSRAPASAVLGPLWLASLENWQALTCLFPTPFFWGARLGKGPHPPALPGWGAHRQPCPGAPPGEQAEYRSSCTPLRCEGSFQFLKP